MTILKKSSTPPKGALLLEESDAIVHQWEQILNWKDKWDVWSFRYGLAFLSGSAAMTAGYIIRHHRMKLKLRDYGFLTSMFGAMVAPSVAAGALHVEYITNDLIIFKTPCPVCLQTRAMMIQLAAGLLYPLIFSPLSCSLMAFQAGIRIPHYSNKLELARMWLKYSKQMVMPLTVMVGIQIITAAGITYFEAKQIYELQEKVSKIESNKNKSSGK